MVALPELAPLDLVAEATQFPGAAWQAEVMDESVAAVEDHEIDAVEIKRSMLFVRLVDRESEAVAIESQRLLQIIDRKCYA